MNPVKPFFKVDFTKRQLIQGEISRPLLGVCMFVEIDSLPSYSHYGFRKITTAIADSKPLIEDRSIAMPIDRLFRFFPDEGFQDVIQCSFRSNEQLPNILNDFSGTIDFVFVDEIETVRLNLHSGLNAQENERVQRELKLVGIKIEENSVEIASHHNFDLVSEYRLVDSNGNRLCEYPSDGRNKDLYSISFYGIDKIPDNVRIEFDFPRKRIQTTIPFSFENIPIGLNR